MALLEIENLTVSFKTSAGPFKAVDGVSLSCDRGEILSIVGESGSGKSVAMLALMGLLPWTATVTADVKFIGKNTIPVRYVLTYRGEDLVTEIWQIDPKLGR